MKRDRINQSDYCGLKKITRNRDEWILEMHSGEVHNYSELRILISNFLFQLMQFSDCKRKKLIVVFHDQLSEQQFRMLTLKSQK